jgi:hypothetical protein
VDVKDDLVRLDFISGDKMIASRREFIRDAGLLSVVAGLAGGRNLYGLDAGVSDFPRRIGRVELDLDRIRKWDDSNGDTWDPFWADDGQLYSFNCDGRGFEICARKSRDYGTMQIVVDGKPVGSVDLETRNLPEIFGAVVFRSGTLPTGKHSVRIVNAGNRPVNLQSVVLY